MKPIIAIAIALTFFLSGAAFAASTQPPASSGDTDPQAVTINVTNKGYEPASFNLQKDVPAKVTFVRKSKTTCGTEIVIPEYNIKRELPLDEPVVVELTPTKTGEFTFACGMDMLKGKIVVVEKSSTK